MYHDFSVCLFFSNMRAVCVCFKERIHLPFWNSTVVARFFVIGLVSVFSGAVHMHEYLFLTSNFVSSKIIVWSHPALTVALESSLLLTREGIWLKAETQTVLGKEKALFVLLLILLELVERYKVQCKRHFYKIFLSMSIISNTDVTCECSLY